MFPMVVRYVTGVVCPARMFAFGYLTGLVVWAALYDVNWIYIKISLSEIAGWQNPDGSWEFGYPRPAVKSTRAPSRCPDTAGDGEEARHDAAIQEGALGTQGCEARVQGRGRGAATGATEEDGAGQAGIRTRHTWRGQWCDDDSSGCSESRWARGVHQGDRKCMPMMQLRYIACPIDHRGPTCRQGISSGTRAWTIPRGGAQL